MRIGHFVCEMWFWKVVACIEWGAVFRLPGTIDSAKFGSPSWVFGAIRMFPLVFGGVRDCSDYRLDRMKGAAIEEPETGSSPGNLLLAMHSGSTVWIWIIHLEKGAVIWKEDSSAQNIKSHQSHVVTIKFAVQQISQLYFLFWFQLYVNNCCWNNSFKNVTYDIPIYFWEKNSNLIPQQVKFCH
jgi:hypothetical protein